MTSAKWFVYMTGMISVLFGFFWVFIAFVGWWVATSGQGWIGLGIMAFVMIIEGIIYNMATKPKTEKQDKGRKSKNRRRRR